MSKSKSFYIQDDVLKNIEQDTFGHKHIAGAVVTSILGTSPPFIVGIFGGWGTGKSSILKLIEDKLEGKNFAHATIDAWKYSSSENLRRAFLVHVAKSLAPKLLNDLRSKLYTSTQENTLTIDNIFDERNDKVLSQVSRVVRTFLIILFVILLIIFAINLLPLLKDGLSWVEFLENYDWEKFIDAFTGNFYIPLLLTLVDYFRFYLIQRPMTIIQERIDADELFTEYFEKVVDEATGKFGKNNQRLVIFVDNLDRLTDDKMVEALESLKTYINNEKCVFVVACDDRVVRAVINKSDKIPRIGDKNNPKETQDYRAGEHYLDKFFQQTFRLPEHMAINLHDFAEKNFETTVLYDKLVKEKIDIRRLITIILPTDVDSPRKVKRLLNDFIALFDIVERRESQGEGQLRPGIITSKPEELGKFSTLRTEYPEFYKLLVENTGLLSELTEMIKLKKGKEEIEKPLEDIKNQLSIESLVSYLRKTQNTMIGDLGRYIWLSQDALSLEIRREHIQQLQISLSDGDNEKFKELVENSETSEYQEQLIRVASRIVEQRLGGIEQQNGAKVLANMLSTFGESIRPEIAHVIAILLPQWSLEAFDALEILNVLEWAHREPDSQRNNLVDHLLERLDIEELRVPTFEAVLANANVIEERNATAKVQKWLREVLSQDSQSAISTPETEGGEEAISNDSNREFAEWLIGEFDKYSENNLVMDKYFSGSLISYMAGRLIGDFEGIPSLDLDEGNLGKSIEKGFDIVAAFVSEGGSSPQFWNGLQRLISESGNLDEYRYSSDHLRNILEQIPKPSIKGLLKAVLIGLNSIVSEDEVSNDWLSEEINLISNLRGSMEEEFNQKDVAAISQNFSELLKLNTHIEPLLAFSEKYSKEFDDSPYPLAIGVVNSFGALGISGEEGRSILETIIRQNDLLDVSLRKVVVADINAWVVSNNETYIENAAEYLTLLSKVDEYTELITEHGASWVNIIQNEAFPLFSKKTSFILAATQNGFIDADPFVAKLIPLIPFGGEQDKLTHILDSLMSIREMISIEAGQDLFNSILTHIGSLGAQTTKALDFISLWIDPVDDGLKSNYSTHLYNQFQSSPTDVLRTLLNVWQAQPEREIVRHLLQIFSVTPDEEYRSLRKENVNLALDQIEVTRRPQIILDIWNSLISTDHNPEEFMTSAIEMVEIADLIQIRENAIAYIRENGGNPQSEVNLRLLTATIRDDVREIMPVVDLFVNLFGRGTEDVQMAVNHVGPALNPLGIRNDHKHKLAEAMGQAALRSEDALNESIHEKGGELGLKRWSYRKYW